MKRYTCKNCPSSLLAISRCSIPWRLGLWSFHPACCLKWDHDVIHAYARIQSSTKSLAPSWGMSLCLSAAHDCCIDVAFFSSQLIIAWPSTALWGFAQRCSWHPRRCARGNRRRDVIQMMKFLTFAGGAATFWAIQNDTIVKYHFFRISSKTSRKTEGCLPIGKSCA